MSAQESPPPRPKNHERSNGATSGWIVLPGLLFHILGGDREATPVANKGTLYA